MNKAEWLHGWMNAPYMMVEDAVLYLGRTEQVKEKAWKRDWVVGGQDISLTPAVDFIDTELEKADDQEVLLGGKFNKAKNIFTVDMVIILDS